MGINEEKKVQQKLPPSKVASMVETIYGCKWSLTVYALLRNGVNRPGEMVRQAEGLSTKVLNSCLKRNLEFGILKKEVFPELPPRVEYSITDFGQQFVGILDQIEVLNEKIK
jgi:DNA-binding HxlR family transcriptional regulator